MSLKHVAPMVACLSIVLAGCVADSASSGAGPAVPLKEAKLNIEHNAKDEDTGFQGFLDSEGWRKMTITGPDGRVLTLQAEGELASLGMTELFFETVEPANADVPIAEILEQLPEGRYRFEGEGVEAGEETGRTTGVAWLTHTIPQGPPLLWPEEGATVPLEDLVVRWGLVDRSIEGKPVRIIAYQLIVEKDETPDPHMIGKRGLSVYLPATTTQLTVPREFLEPGTAYLWEVLAIEESGNQALMSGAFQTSR